MLSFWYILAYISLLLLFFFPFGYLLMHWKENEHLRSLSFPARLPIYIGLGMAAACLVFFIVGHFRINVFIPWGMLLTCLLLLLIRYRHSLGQVKRRVETCASWRPKLDITALLPLLLFVFSLVIFARLVGYTGAMPIWGDPLPHSLFVSVFLHYDKIVYSLDPATAGGMAFSDITSYPIGFHTLGAIAALVTGRFPGESIFLLGASVAILTPCLLYSFVYAKTRSLFLSLTAFLLVFMAPTLDPFPLRSYAFYSGFLQGCYPGFLGTYFLFLFGYLAACLPKPLDPRARKWYFLQLAIAALVVLIAYRSLFIFTLLYSAIAIAYSNRTTIKVIATSRYRTIAAIAAIAFLTGMAFLARTLLPRLMAWTFGMTDGERLSDYYVPASFLITNANGYIVLAATLAVVGLLALRRHLIFCFMYVSVLIPSYLAFNWDFFTNLLWLITPMRSIWILIPLSYVALLLFVHSAFAVWRPLRRIEQTVLPYSKVLVTIILLAFLVLTFVPPLSSAGFAVFNYKPQHTAIYPNEEEWQAMAWIAENVPQIELILNDMTWAGHFIPAFGFQYQVYYGYTANCPERRSTRLNASRAILDDPGNYGLVHDVITTWQIKYIYITSTNVYPDYCPQTFHLTNRSCDSAEILEFFDKNPDLRAEFRTERVGVYSTYLAFAPDRDETADPNV